MMAAYEGYECERGDPPVSPRLQSASRHSEQGFDDDRQNRRLDAKEKSFDDRELPKTGIKHREGENHARAGQYEEEARGKATFHAVHAPASIGGELHGLRPRQQHAEVQGGQVFLLGQPFSLIDDLPVHERDLSRRSPERQAADPRPDLHSLPE